MKLSELRDELAESNSRNYPRRSGHTHSFKTGFDCGAKAVMVEAEKLNDTLAQVCFGDLTGFGCECKFCSARARWTEFVSDERGGEV